jgi:hypothetical protein
MVRAVQSPFERLAIVSRAHKKKLAFRGKIRDVLYRYLATQRKEERAQRYSRPALPLVDLRSYATLEVVALHKINGSTGSKMCAILQKAIENVT